MRLLHVFPSFAVGGPQVRFCSLAAGLDPGWQHDVIALDGRLDCREHLAPALPVRFPAPPRPGLRGALRRLRALRPELLVTYNWGAMDWVIANALAGLRHVHLEDGFGPEESRRQLARRVWTRRLALRRATVVLPSLTLLRLATERWRLPPAHLHYIANGIDLARFAPAPPAPPAAVPVIGSVAALRPEKNLGRLLHAFAAVARERPARLVIVGDGPERGTLETLAARLGIATATTFVGHLPDPAAAYRGFDIFALSSDTEQMPLALLEAMAAGLPVAATAVGDVAAMLAPPNRRFVTPPDATALAAALAALLDAPALRRALGAANRARAVSEYDQATMLRRYAAIFAGTASGAAGGRVSCRRQDSATISSR